MQIPPMYMQKIGSLKNADTVNKLQVDANMKCWHQDIPNRKRINSRKLFSLREGI